MVSLLALYSDDPSSNPVEVYLHLSTVKLFEVCSYSLLINFWFKRFSEATHPNKSRQGEQKSPINWPVVVAQLAARSLSTLEVRGSNPVIGKILSGTFVCCGLYREDGNKEKGREWGPIFE